MVDIKFLRSQTEKIQSAIEKKHIDLDLGQLLSLDKEVGALTLDLQNQQRQKNENALKFKTTKTNEEKEKLRETGKTLSLSIQQTQALLREKQGALKTLLLKVPNIPSPDSPVGKDESANKLLKQVGQKPTAPTLSHVDFLLKNQGADFQRIAQVAGTRSYMLKNQFVLLEQAFIQWGLQFLAKKGWTLFSLPNFGDQASFIGSGHFPEGKDQVYYIEKDNTYLTGTSEVLLNALYRGEILSQESLPRLMAGLSHCFRREAGSAGKDVRGLLRVHQFLKLEQYVICENALEKTKQLHHVLLNNAEEILQALELPYQVVMVSTGDMGAGKYQMHDIECYLPSLNKYIETHSCSSLLDWQARRTGLRYRDGDGKVHYCHTLNNTAIALPRLLAVFLEIHQRGPHTLYLPVAIRPFLGGQDTLCWT